VFLAELRINEKHSENVVIAMAARNCFHRTLNPRFMLHDYCSQQIFSKFKIYSISRERMT